MCCAYCSQNHLSSECNEVEEGDYEHYNCSNCEELGEQSLGHSAMWHKCPTYLAMQKKLRKSIPYYRQSKN